MELFLTITLALVGGLIAKKLKFQPIIGYILAGIIASSILPSDNLAVVYLAEIGSVLLLFSIGLELPINKFKNLFKRVLLASIIQILVVSLLLFLVLSLLGIGKIESVILAIGFSLSSTAVVVKMLFDRGESETIHGRQMVGWLLVQDLAVVPIMIILPLLTGGHQGMLLASAAAIFKSIAIIGVSIVLGKTIVPFLIHKVASLNSRELLLLTSVSLAIGTATAMSYFGISPALGAFIAGFVISESQENHAVFAETRPLKNLFVALFFVTLGFFVSPQIIALNFIKIVAIAVFVILTKFITVLFINYLFRFNGKTMVLSALGLAQVGEFAFIIFSSANILGLISKEISSLGIAVGLLTLIVSPLIYSNSLKFWKILKNRFKLFSSLERNTLDQSSMSNHIVILGFGRVGGWVGKALMDHNINFLVVDFDQEVINNCHSKGINAIYGDPSENEVLDMANITLAKAVVIAIPDRLAQESIVAHVQTVAPNVKIISRVHLDEDWEKLKSLRVDKLVQPEFEAAASIIKNILASSGRSREEVNKSIKSIRLSHAKI